MLTLGAKPIAGRVSFRPTSLPPPLILHSSFPRSGQKHSWREQCSNFQVHQGCSTLLGEPRRNTLKCQSSGSGSEGVFFFFFLVRFCFLMGLFPPTDRCTWPRSSPRRLVLEPGGASSLGQGSTVQTRGAGSAPAAVPGGW